MRKMRCSKTENLCTLYFIGLFAISLFENVLLTGYTTANSTVDSSDGTTKECKQVVSSQHGVFHSPNYPENYPRYSRCEYVVERSSPDVCEVKLILDVFDVAMMTYTECSEDFLELQDMDKRYRICGTLPPGTKKFVVFPTYSDQLVFKFQTTFHEKKGFQIQVKQLSYSCSNHPKPTKAPTRAPSPCTQSVKGRIGRLVFPNKSLANKCIYYIHRSEARACLLRMDFATFEVRSTAGCEQDYLLLPDGQKLCGVLGGIQKFLQFSTDSEELIITSVGRDNRFDIQVMQLPGPCESDSPTTNQTETSRMHQCDKEIRSSTGVLTSPGYPGNFGPNFNCVYRIYRRDVSVCRLQLDFVEFSLGKHNPASCSSGAYLELPGKNRLCHDIDGKMMISVSEFQDPVVMEFVSDSRSSGNGFFIEIMQISNTCPGFEVQSQIANLQPPRCYQEVSGVTGHFSPPPVTATCEWVIHRAHPDVCVVRLQVSARSYFTVPCRHNFIRLPQGHTMCVSLSERREVEFAEGAPFMTLDYSSWHFPMFNLFVDQIRNSCKKRREVYAAQPMHWTFKVAPRSSLTEY